MSIHRFDAVVIGTAKHCTVPFARGAFFFVFFWFGILKAIGMSPATPLVDHLLAMTLPFVEPAAFNIFFGTFEMLIGVLFLVPRMERVVIPLFMLHMFTTMMPLVFLPGETWAGPFVPTLEGQYILKNLVLLALGTAFVANMSRLDGEMD